MSLRFLTLALTGLAATLFWDSPFLLPVKWLVVLVHEMWHGIASLLSGARLDEIIIHPSESGETMVSGLDSSFGFVMSVSAGYIGSTLTGALLLSRGLKSGYERLALAVFALMLWYMSYLFTGSGSLAFFTGIGWASGLLLLALAGRVCARYTLIVIGTLFVWYCLYDMFDFTGSTGRTDAAILAIYLKNKNILLSARESWISAVWFVAVLSTLFLILRSAFMKPAQPAPQPVELPPPPPAAFPGEVTPEIQEWFLTNGFDPEGNPLPDELFELQNSPAAGAEDKKA